MINYILAFLGLVFLVFGVFEGIIGNGWYMIGTWSLSFIMFVLCADYFDKKYN